MNKHKRNSNGKCYDSHNCVTCKHALDKLTEYPCIECVSTQCQYKKESDNP